MIFLETSKLSNQHSGLGQFCLNLGHAISELNEEFDLTYFVPKSCRDIFGDRHRYLINYWWKRVTGISAEADLWHCFYQGSRYWPKKRNTKVVLTVHDLNFTIKYTGWKLRREMSLMQRQVTRADAIVAISDFTRKEILKYLTVDPKKISVIYDGVNIPPVEEKRPSYINDEKFFFSVGIISEKKNFHVLLPLLKQVEGSLIIAGNNTSTYAKQLVKQAESLGLSDRVILPGEISEEEKRWLYRHCEAFLFPSLAEGFGLPVIEAMSEGKPVFCSNLTSLPEVAGPHSYYFNDFHPDRMKEVLVSGLKDYQQDPQKREAIKGWASQYSWAKACQQYFTIYRTLLA